MRPIIEVVFDRSAPAAVPPQLMASDQVTYGKSISQVGLAAQNVLDLQHGYAIETGPGIQTPTYRRAWKTSRM